MLAFNILKKQISVLKREVLPNICVRREGTQSISPPHEEENTEKIKKVIRKKHSLSECLEYMNSNAYETTYGNKPVWHVYIRNFKGAIPPETRNSCFTSKGILITGSPCPICRDEYLLPHYQNVKLLEQFISPFGGTVLKTRITGVCQKQQLNLTVAIKKAQNYGLLKTRLTHRYYNYSLYNKK